MSEVEVGTLAVLDAIEHHLIEKEPEITWEYYSICPSCGSQNIDRYRNKKLVLWNFCPDCGQKIKKRRDQGEQDISSRTSYETRKTIREEHTGTGKENVCNNSNC